MSFKKIRNIRTGVIGVGSMGQNHARIYNDIGNLVAVSDMNEEQGKEVANRFGVKWYKDYKKMLNSVDAVSIAVPTFLHHDIANIVCKSGTHLLVEKPLAGSYVEAEKIVSAASKANVVLSVGHVERHNPVVSFAKQEIVEGNWGEIITLSSRRVSSFPRRVHDVGVLFDLSIHDIDISTYISGSDVVSVYASGGSKKAEHEDYVNLIMEHESGTISICETNWLTPMKIRKLGITTSNNYVELDYQDQIAKIFQSKYIKVNSSNLYDINLEYESKEIPMKNKEPLFLELVDFLESIYLKKSPMVTGEEGSKVVQVSEAALESLLNKKMVFIK